MFVSRVTSRRSGCETKSTARFAASVALVLILIFATKMGLKAQVASASSIASTRTADASLSSAGELQTAFEVRFLEFDNVYLNLRPGAPLAKGMTLLVRRSQNTNAEVIAELKVKSVSSSSAICEVLVMRDNLQRGDLAYLTPDEIAALMKQQAPRPAPASVQASARQMQVATVPAAALSSVAITAKNAAASASQQPIAVQPQKALSTLATAKAPDMGTAAAFSGNPSSAALSPVKVKSTNSPQATTVQTRANPPAQISVGTQNGTATPSTTTAAVNAQPTSVVGKIPTSPSSPQFNPGANPASAPTTLSSVQSGTSSQPMKVTTQTATAATGASAADLQSQRESAWQNAKTSDSGAPDVATQEASDAAGFAQSQDIALPAQDGSRPNVETIFKIKFVAQDTVYLSAGTGTGLTPGMKLVVKHSEPDITAKGTLAKASQTPTIAELQVISVATSSSVCAVQKKTADIQPGDLAFMDEATAELLAEKKALSATRKYPQVVSFNEGDPLEEEVREEVPRPPLPEVNRIRGRFGFDYGSINSVGSVVSNNSQMGLVVRADFTRIGGSYWNLSGYWRGRLNNSSVAEQPTLQDLINRTYHLNLTYSNPTSPWVAGFGRLYLPWATSLDTIDGGYVGRKEGKHLLLGLFAGSTPDPTSWDYNPDRRLGGVFMNLEGGSFDSFRVSSTSGIAVSTLLWKVDRPFVFFENGLYFKRYLSIYDSTQADDPRPAPGITAPGPGLSRNFLTLRFQPHERISFDVDHNYFRDVPTFSTALIATGLLDKYLFQGLSTGARVEPIRHITFYASVGKSSRTGDASSSWNEMYGVTLARIPRTGLRVDVRTSKFDSSFGNGKYRSVSLSRNFRDALNLDVQVGQQFLSSQLSSQTESRFVNATLDGNLGRNYFVQGAYTVERGGTFNYNQWTVTFGYRFDNHGVGLGK